jgi:molecular chaperone GrpE
VTPPPANEAVAELKDKWLRAEAELQNVRRRAQRDLEEGLRFAEEQVFIEIISWLDDLERAIEVARESGAPENWIQGVQLVAQRMTEYLARRDVKAAHPLGEMFDPRFHEALLEIDAPEAPPGSVIQVVRKGYQRGDRALRAARVVVARRPHESEA